MIKFSVEPWIWNRYFLTYVRILKSTQKNILMGQFSFSKKGLKVVSFTLFYDFFFQIYLKDPSGGIY